MGTCRGAGNNPPAADATHIWARGMRDDPTAFENAIHRSPHGLGVHPRGSASASVGGSDAPGLLPAASQVLPAPWGVLPEAVEVLPPTGGSNLAATLEEPGHKWDMTQEAGMPKEVDMTQDGGIDLDVESDIQLMLTRY